MKSPITIHTLRDGTASRDRAIVDLLQLEELGLVPGSVSVRQLRELWAASQSQVSRRMTAIHQLGRYWVKPGWGRYKLMPDQPKLSSRERWEAVRQQLQEALT